MCLGLTSNPESLMITPGGTPLDGTACVHWAFVDYFGWPGYSSSPEGARSQARTLLRARSSNTAFVVVDGLGPPIVSHYLFV